MTVAVETQVTAHNGISMQTKTTISYGGGESLQVKQGV